MPESNAVFTRDSWRQVVCLGAIRKAQFVSPQPGSKRPAASLPIRSSSHALVGKVEGGASGFSRKGPFDRVV